MDMPLGKGKTLLIIQIICLAIAWVAVSIRLYTRTRILDGNRWEDYLMYAALVLYSAQSAFVIYGVLLGGIGHLVSSLSVTQISIALKAWYVCESIYGPLSAVIRTSIGIFIARISANTINSWAVRIILWISLGFMWAFTIVYLFINIFQCSPTSFYWQQFEEYNPHSSCRNSRRVPIAAICHSVFAAVCDCILGGLPIWTLWGGRFGMLRRVGLLTLLGFGIMAGVVMVVRIPYIRILQVSTNFLSETVDVAICSIIEPCLGIVAGCLPTVWCLWGNVARRRLNHKSVQQLSTYG